MTLDRNLTDQDYELLSAYIDGVLSDSERSALERRLQTEATLQNELEALRRTIQLIEQMPTLKAPRAFTLDARLVERRRPQRQRRVMRFPTFSPVMAAAAAMIMILFGAGIILTQLSPTAMDISGGVASNLSDTGASASLSTEVAMQATSLPTLTIEANSGRTEAGAPPEEQVDSMAPSVAAGLRADENAQTLAAGNELPLDESLTEGEEVADDNADAAPAGALVPATPSLPAEIGGMGGGSGGDGGAFQEEETAADAPPAPSLALVAPTGAAREAPGFYDATRDAQLYSNTPLGQQPTEEDVIGESALDLDGDTAATSSLEGEPEEPDAERYRQDAISKTATEETVIQASTPVPLPTSVAAADDRTTEQRAQSEVSADAVESIGADQTVRLILLAAGFVLVLAGGVILIQRLRSSSGRTE